MWLIVLLFPSLAIVWLQCSSKKTVTMPVGLLSAETTHHQVKSSGAGIQQVSKTQEPSDNQQKREAGKEEGKEEKTEGDKKEEEKKGGSKMAEAQAATNQTQTMDEGKGVTMVGKTQETVSGQRKVNSKTIPEKGPSGEKTQDAKTNKTVTVEPTANTKVSAEKTKPSTEPTKPSTERASNEKVKVEETMDTVEDKKTADGEKQEKEE